MGSAVFGGGVWRRWLPWLFLAALPVLAHVPALSGRFRIDPIYLVSGLTPGTWASNGVVAGYPWIDGNAGVTTEALGGLAAQDWLHLTLPWWNHFSGVGLPLTAEGQSPAFFLPFVLLLALPHGLLLLRMVLMALAGCATFALLRRLRLADMPALMGAVLFELNGVFAWVLHGPVMPVAFLPLMLLGLERSRTRFSWALVLGVAWNFAAGFPETAALDVLFAGVWVGVRLAQAPDRLAYAGRAGAAGLAGLLVAAPAIWPFMEALPREFLGSHAGVVGSGLTAPNVAMLLFPGVFGPPLARPAVLGHVFVTWFSAGGYCDVVLVVLAACALRWRAPDRAMRWALLGWLAVSFARAAKLPAGIWLFGLVPLLRQANIHLYVLPGWSMALSVLAAYALQDWRDGVARDRWRMAALVGVLGVVSAWLAAPDVAALWRAVPGYKAFLMVSLAVPALTLGAVWFARGPALYGAIAANAAILFMLPQSAGLHGRRVDTGAIAYLQGNLGLGRVLSLGPLVPNYGALFGVAEIGHNYLPVPANWVAYVRAHLMAASDGVNFYAGAAPEKLDLAAYEAAGVSMVTVAPGGGHFAAGAAALVYRGDVMDIWRLADPAPYFAATGCRLAPVSRDALVARCAGPSVLKRLELAWPGWGAEVNGGAVTVAREGGIFQAVALPAGESRVVFGYAPPGIAYAWVACVGGLVLACGMQMRRRRR
jgi:hypothetical protein